MRKLFTLLLSLLAIAQFHAQVGQGALKGTVTDESGTGVPFANIALKMNQNLASGTATDFDGNFEMKPIPPGTYTVEITSLGYAPVQITNVRISSDKTTFLDKKSTQLTSAVVQLETFLMVENRVSLIESDGAATSTTVTSSEIGRMASRSPAALAAAVGGTYAKGDGSAGVTARGQRSDANYYYIDGIKVRGSSAIPQQDLIDHLFVGGLPARYSGESGDFVDAWDMSEAASDGPGIFDGGLKKPRYKKGDIQVSPRPLPEAEYPLAYLFEGYESYSENEFEVSMEEPLSTVSIDVDKGSYSNMRRIINSGYLPPLASVRLEEFVNYFPYDRIPNESGDPFVIDTELGDCPWNANHQLLRVTMQADELSKSEQLPSNLVFLIDVSGSMSASNKLGLVKRAFRLLTDQLMDDDRVSIVVYAGSAGVVLDGARGSDKSQIEGALSRLSAGGSTAGGAGIQKAYALAEKYFLKKGNNRVILATDGDFNVGVSSDDELVKLIESKRSSGVFFTTLGFGMGNYKDSKLEKLADHGNGAYAYIDTYQEARKVFLKELQGTLFTVAKDVKFQIEFNPAKVSSYRLLGYENRVMAAKDFNDDTKDAGELGAGQMVTVFYEIVTPGTYAEADSLEIIDKRYQKVALRAEADSDEFLFLKIRYKLPNEDKSILIERPVMLALKESASTSESFRFGSAVVQFGLLLRDSKFKGEANLKDVLATAGSAIEFDPEGYRREFITLAEMAGEMYATVE